MFVLNMMLLKSRTGESSLFSIALIVCYWEYIKHDE